MSSISWCCLSSFKRTVCIVASAVTLVSCGGGGGGGGGSGGASNEAFTVSPSSVSLSAVQAGRSSSQTLTITATRGSIFINDSKITQSGGFFSRSSLTFTSQTTAQFTITPQSTATPGTFTGSVTIRVCSNPTCDGSDAAGSPKVIPITFSVTPFAGLRMDPPAIDFVTRTGVLPSSKSATIAQSSGSTPWTVSGLPSWLSVTPPSGTLTPAQSLTFNVTNASSPGVQNATVTFTAGALTKDVPVSLVVNAPQANFVAPYVVPAGTAGQVIIRGYGFLTLSTPLQVSFGGTPATAAFVQSDTEIGATYPALAAGSHAITVGNGIAVPSRSGLKLVAITPPAYSAVTIPRPSSPGNVVDLIYDGERQAVYLLDSNNRIERYTFASGTWNTSQLVVGSGGNAHLALAPDGTQLIKTNGAAPSLEVVDPATLSSTTVAATFTGLASPASLGSIAFANDGNAIGSASGSASGIALYRYDMLLQRFTGLSWDSTDATAFASGDGDTVILPTFDPGASNGLPFVYDASAGSILQGNQPVTRSSRLSISRDSANILRVITSDTVFGAPVVTSYGVGAFTIAGTLPAGVTGFVVSPDGNTAYAYINNAVRKFNLTMPSNGGFVETGSVSVVSPGTSSISMAITPDGGTLFVAGNTNLLVVPAP